jgi:hypothetical protein
MTYRELLGVAAGRLRYGWDPSVGRGVGTSAGQSATGYSISGALTYATADHEIRDELWYALYHALPASDQIVATLDEDGDHCYQWYNECLESWEGASARTHEQILTLFTLAGETAAMEIRS